jgi:hypothetical protein
MSLDYTTVLVILIDFYYDFLIHFKLPKHFFYYGDYDGLFCNDGICNW